VSGVCGLDMGIFSVISGDVVALLPVEIQAVAVGWHLGCRGNWIISGQRCWV
jgi:hypothetical protein